MSPKKKTIEEEKAIKLSDALDTLAKERSISVEKLCKAVEDAVLKAYERENGTDMDISVEFNKDTGELRLWQRKLVVPEVEDPNTEISIEEAKEFDEEADFGTELEIQLEVLNAANNKFSRIATQTAKQVIFQRIREFERDTIREEYDSLIGTIVSGSVIRIERREVFINLGKTEGVIPVSQQAHHEYLETNKVVRALVIGFRENAKGSCVELSRSSPKLVCKLFESHVPEIEKGTVQIKAVVREAGLRTKIAVKSNEDDVDPVGACVGNKGERVQNIVKELNNEKIDIIPWSDNPAEFVANSLQPSRVTRVVLDEETKHAEVVVPDNQLPLAIGRDGQNVRLAAKLTEWHIDIKSESAAAAELHEAAEAAPAGEETPAEE